MYCDAKIVLKMKDYKLCDTLLKIDGSTYINFSSKFKGEQCLVFPLFMSEEDIRPNSDGYYVFDLYESKIYHVGANGQIKHNFPEEFPLMVVLLKDIDDCFITVKTNVCQIRTVNSKNEINLPSMWNTKDIIIVPYHHMTADDDVFVFDSMILYNAKVKAHNYNASVCIAEKYKDCMCFISYLPDPISNEDNVQFLLDHF